jgi:hypothetical protein
MTADQARAVVVGINRADAAITARARAEEATRPALPVPEARGAGIWPLLKAVFAGSLVTLLVLRLAAKRQ